MPGFTARQAFLFFLLPLTVYKSIFTPPDNGTFGDPIFDQPILTPVEPELLYDTVDSTAPFHPFLETVDGASKILYDHIVNLFDGDDNLTYDFQPLLVALIKAWLWASDWLSFILNHPWSTLFVAFTIGFVVVIASVLSFFILRRVVRWIHRQIRLELSEIVQMTTMFAAHPIAGVNSLQHDPTLHSLVSAAHQLEANLRQQMLDIGQFMETAVESLKGEAKGDINKLFGIVQELGQLCQTEFANTRIAVDALEKLESVATSLEAEVKAGMQTLAQNLSQQVQSVRQEVSTQEGRLLQHLKTAIHNEVTSLAAEFKQQRADSLSSSSALAAKLKEHADSIARSASSKSEVTYLTKTIEDVKTLVSELKQQRADTIASSAPGMPEAASITKKLEDVTNEVASLKENIQSTVKQEVETLVPSLEAPRNPDEIPDDNEAGWQTYQHPRRRTNRSAPAPVLGPSYGYEYEELYGSGDTGSRFAPLGFLDPQQGSPISPEAYQSFPGYSQYGYGGYQQQQQPQLQPFPAPVVSSPGFVDPGSQQSSYPAPQTAEAFQQAQQLQPSFIPVAVSDKYRSNPPGGRQPSPTAPQTEVRTTQKADTGSMQQLKSAAMPDNAQAKKENTIAAPQKSPPPPIKVSLPRQTAVASTPGPSAIKPETQPTAQPVPAAQATVAQKTGDMSESMHARSSAAPAVAEPKGKSPAPPANAPLAPRKMVEAGYEAGPPAPAAPAKQETKASAASASAPLAQQKAGGMAESRHATETWTGPGAPRPEPKKAAPPVIAPPAPQTGMAESRHAPQPSTRPAAPKQEPKKAVPPAITPPAPQTGMAESRHAPQSSSGPAAPKPEPKKPTPPASAPLAPTKPSGMSQSRHAPQALPLSSGTGKKAAPAPPASAPLAPRRASGMQESRFAPQQAESSAATKSTGSSTVTAPAPARPEGMRESQHAPQPTSRSASAMGSPAADPEFMHRFQTSSNSPGEGSASPAAPSATPSAPTSVADDGDGDAELDSPGHKKTPRGHRAGKRFQEAPPADKERQKARSRAAEIKKKEEARKAEAEKQRQQQQRQQQQQQQEHQQQQQQQQQPQPPKDKGDDEPGPSQDPPKDPPGGSGAGKIGMQGSRWAK